MNEETKLGSKKLAPLGIIITVAVVLAVTINPKSAHATSSGTAIVSYYGGGGPDECGEDRPCHGSQMANGQVFNMYDSGTVAHKSLPFGTEVKFCHKGKCLKAKVKDRGPFVKGREFDLSRAAAIELGFVATGVAEVEFQVLGRSKKKKS